MDLFGTAGSELGLLGEAAKDLGHQREHDESGHDDVVHLQPEEWLTVEIGFGRRARLSAPERPDP